MRTNFSGRYELVTSSAMKTKFTGEDSRAKEQTRYLPYEVHVFSRALSPVSVKHRVSFGLLSPLVTITIKHHALSSPTLPLLPRGSSGFASHVGLVLRVALVPSKLLARQLVYYSHSGYCSPPLACLLQKVYQKASCLGDQMSPNHFVQSQAKLS